MNDRYILALDQGTTSSRAIVFDHGGRVVRSAQREFPQHYPQPGWVEQSAEDIWISQRDTAMQVLADAGLRATQIAAIGISNQRETSLIWERSSGRPIHPAIVWQDRRTAAWCDRIKQRPKQVAMIRAKTGLLPDAYFSASKIRWLLEHVDGAYRRALDGELAFGTVDSWLIWNLTGGRRHVTDATNASRTMLFNIHDGGWDAELLALFDVPAALLPEVAGCSEVYGETTAEWFGAPIAIAGLAGDQQAALFGQRCCQAGMAKNTYGTGCFLVLNTGSKAVVSQHDLLTTIAYRIDDQTHYALEGSVFIAGAVVGWLRDRIGLIQSAAQIEPLAETVSDSQGVHLVPAFAGLGAPHWNPHARAMLTGLTLGSTAGHIARAALEGIAFQVHDVIAAMQADTGVELRELRVDGGAAANNLLMQFQADLIGVPVERPRIVETTALGAAYLAGLAVGFWTEAGEIDSQRELDRRFAPTMHRDEARQRIAGWNRALRAVAAWSADRR